jgi:gliding motility-associated-like protein
LRNPPSACLDTLIRDVESFSPPLVGISGDSTYCPGLTTWIKAYGAAEYTWNDGSKADSIEIAAPGGKIWLLGYSTTGCVSDTNDITINQEPDWQFMPHGDTIICGNDQIEISASGAASYSWNTGNVDDSLVVDTPGQYSVTGKNRRGCEKILRFNVEQHPVPLAEFTVTPDAIDSRHNKVSCTVPAVDGVDYLWMMGDGYFEKGSDIKHLYNVSNNTLEYLITLAATSEYQCADSTSKYIDVVPFIPNVFTPGGDGINDVFMPGFEQQIVDRNGLKIYNGNEGWDGRFNGQDVDPDTYFFLIFYKDSKDVINTRKGYITLVR